MLQAADISPADLSPPPVQPAWYELRSASPEELPVVCETWAGTWKRSRAAGCIPNDLFDRVTYAAIQQLLDRGMQVRVLVDRGRPDLVLSWVAYELDPRKPGSAVVHYVFTREPLRRRGYAQLLLDDIGAGRDFVYTHKTGFSRYWPGATHNPGIARRKEL